MEEAIVPTIYDPEEIYEQIMVDTKDALEMTHQIVKEEGIFVGMSRRSAPFFSGKELIIQSIIHLQKALWHLLAKLSFPHDDRIMLNRLLGHYNYQNSLVNELTGDIKQLSQTDRYRMKCAILCSFRGIQVLTAMIILTHIPDFRAFPHPSKLISYIGLTSKEDSSGDSVIKTGITKQGNGILRKAIVMAAQQYNRAERTGTHMITKRKGLPSKIIHLSQRADRRCKNKYYRLIDRGKHSNVAKTAVARELVSFIWKAMIIYYQGELQEAV